MAEATKAAFGLIDFKIPKFSYNESKKDKSELNISFETKGVFSEEKSRYELFLEVKGIEGNDTIIFESLIMGLFEFSEKIEKKDIPEYFYANAIAILFPYLRAFVSNLTLQSNSGVIIMDTLNLSKMKESLKMNTTTQK